MNEVNEKLGYLARWGLIALACVLVLAMAGLSAYGTQSLPEEFAAQLVAPDYIKRPVKPPAPTYLRCWVKGGASQARSLIWHSEPGRIHHGNGTTETVFLRFYDPPASGLVKIYVRGNPYSALSMSKVDSVVRIAPKGKRLYLVDARIVDRILQDKVSRMEHLNALEDMRRMGDVAMFYTGNYTEMAELRERLHKHNLTDAIISPTKDGPAIEVVHRARYELGLKSLNLTVVTSDLSLAAVSIRCGYITDLVQDDSFLRQPLP